MFLWLILLDVSCVYVCVLAYSCICIVFLPSKGFPSRDVFDPCVSYTLEPRGHVGIFTRRIEDCFYITILCNDSNCLEMVEVKDLVTRCPLPHRAGVPRETNPGLAESSAPGRLKIEFKFQFLRFDLLMKARLYGVDEHFVASINSLNETPRSSVGLHMPFFMPPR